MNDNLFIINGHNIARELWQIKKDLLTRKEKLDQKRILPLFSLLHVPAWLVLKLFTGAKVHNPENLLLDEPGVVVCNHIYKRDPVLIWVLLNSSVFYQTKPFVFSKYELHQNKILDLIIRGVGGMPVIRPQDIKEDNAKKDIKSNINLDAILLAWHVLENEENTKVIIHPEGTRNKTDQPLLPFEKGFVKVATRKGYPITPSIISYKNGTDLYALEPITDTSLESLTKNEVLEKERHILTLTRERMLEGLRNI